MKRIILLLIFLFFLLPLYSTGQKEEQRKTGISIFVSILPQVYFVERIGGDWVSVQELVPPGREPHVYEPSPKQMASLSMATMYFTIGVPFEKVFLPKIKDSMTHVIIVDTSAGVTFRHLEGHEDDNPGDAHPLEKDHHEQEIQDPHIWLGTREVKIQLVNIRNALITYDPDGTSYYESNYRQFIREIDSLHTRINKAIEPVRGEKFFVFHPSFGYFADEYGLEQFAVEIEGKEPGPEQLARIIEKVREQKVKVLFVQPQFSQNQAHIIADYTGCLVVPIDPLNKEWLSNMEELAKRIEEGLKQ